MSNANEKRYFAAPNYRIAEAYVDRCRREQHTILFVDWTRNFIVSARLYSLPRIEQPNHRRVIY
ncbi:MAG TPA: hypothetical protein VMW36_09920 [Patescibacteria group bacterium]|nr:hypothetical protein [Patescibacteria group bacterium]